MSEIFDFMSFSHTGVSILMKSIDYSPIIFFFFSMWSKPHIVHHYVLFGEKKNRLGCQQRSGSSKVMALNSLRWAAISSETKRNVKASGQSCWNYYEISVCGGLGQANDREHCTQMLLGSRDIYHADSSMLHYLILVSPLAELEEQVYK